MVQKNKSALASVTIMPKNKKVKYNNVGWASQYHETLEIEEFLELQPISIQRETAFRVGTVAKFLNNNPQPTHNEVAIAEYPDAISGALVRRVINANTRGDIWAAALGKKSLTGIDQHEQYLKRSLRTSIEKLNVPSEVIATIYPCRDEKAAEAIYKTYDSLDSVEKSNDKITGLCRSMGIVFKNLGVLKRGTFSKALQFAAAGYPDVDTLEGQLACFTKELETIDALATTQSKDVYNANILSAMLKMFKKYGTTDKKVRNILSRLEDNERGPSSKSKGKDGITFLLEEIDSNELFQNGWQTSSIAFPAQQDFILWCFENFVKDKNMKQYKRPAPPSTRGKGSRANLHNTFWDFLEDDE